MNDLVNSLIGLAIVLAILDAGDGIESVILEASHCAAKAEGQP